MTPCDPPPDLPSGSVPTVPDDARDLARDVRALHRERRTQRRKALLRSVLLTRRWDRYGLSGPLVVAVLLVVAAYATLPVLLRPEDFRRSASAPLASPSTPPGLVGGLLPDGPVLTPAGPTTLRELPRPTALLLVPVPCDCEQVLADAVPQLLPSVRSIRVVTSGRLDPEGREAAALRSGQGRGQVDAGLDVDGVLAAAYAPVGVTLVLVGADGVVVDVVRDLREDQSLATSLRAPAS